MAVATVEKKTKMRFQPLGDRVLVKREAAEEKTAGGIVLPDAAKDKSMRAKVLAVGNGKLRDNGTRVAPAVKRGDRVLLAKYGGDELKVQGKELLLVREEDILAIIRD